MRCDCFCRVSTHSVESISSPDPLRSMQLQMKDSSGISFNAELFHVAVPSLRTACHYELRDIKQGPEQVKHRTVQVGSGERAPDRNKSGAMLCRTYLCA